MRSLRPDPLFDNIIRVVFPNRADLDKQQSMLLAKLDKNNNRKAMLSSFEEGLRHQAERRGAIRKARSGRRKRPTSSTRESSVPSEISIKTEPNPSPEPSVAKDEVDEVVSLEVIPHRKQTRGRSQAIAKKWKRRYVKVKGSGTGKFALPSTITQVLSCGISVVGRKVFCAPRN